MISLRLSELMIALGFLTTTVPLGVLSFQTTEQAAIVISPGALTLGAAVVGSLVTAIGVLFRLVIVLYKERAERAEGQVDRLMDLAKSTASSGEIIAAASTTGRRRGT